MPSLYCQQISKDIPDFFPLLAVHCRWQYRYHHQIPLGRDWARIVSYHLQLDDLQHHRMAQKEGFWVEPREAKVDLRHYLMEQEEEILAVLREDEVDLMVKEVEG